MIKSCLACLSHVCYASSSIERQEQSLVQAFRKLDTRKSRAGQENRVLSYEVKRLQDLKTGMV